MQTRSMKIRQGGHDSSIELPPVPLEERYACAWAALRRDKINIPDIRADQRFDFSGSLRYDEMTGYRTVSMLVIPMLNDRGALIGVMQLINALDGEGKVIPFEKEEELLIAAIASQAAISITNIQYTNQISTLLNSLVQALSTAVDERSAYTGNHTRRMVRLAGLFLDWLAETGHPWSFSQERRSAFLMSVWLHDIGKLTIPLEVMDKATRLGDRKLELLNRLRFIGVLDRVALLEGKISPEEWSKRNHHREEIRDFILEIDGGRPLSDADRERVEKIAGLTYIDENRETHPWITDTERDCLLIGKGTLTQSERAVMESHVVMTKRILDQVTFPPAYEKVPAWVAAHHEFLNGSGYPEHMTAEAIAPEARLLTILDVFEALTAKDRPYKGPMPAEKAFLTLHDMAEKGQIDNDTLSLFEKSRVWEPVSQKT